MLVPEEGKLSGASGPAAATALAPRLCVSLKSVSLSRVFHQELRHCHPPGYQGPLPFCEEGPCPNVRGTACQQCVQDKGLGEEEVMDRAGGEGVSSGLDSGLFLWRA